MHFNLQASPIAQRVLLTSHAASLTIVWLTTLPNLIQIAISLLILFGLLHYRALLLQQSHSAFTLEADQTITLISPLGISQNGTIAHDTVVTPYFVLLRIKIETEHFTINLPIFYDALPADAFHQLRIRLKYAA